MENIKMTRYSVPPRDGIFVKGYGSLSFPKNVCRNIGKIISKNLSSKCGQKLIDHAKQSAYIKKRDSKNSQSNWWFDWI